MIEVVIVGAGISGLTLAVTLSRYPDFNVTVLERAAALELENVSSPLNPLSFHQISLMITPPSLERRRRPPPFVRKLIQSTGRQWYTSSLQCRLHHALSGLTRQNASPGETSCDIV